MIGRGRPELVPSEPALIEGLQAMQALIPEQAALLLAKVGTVGQVQGRTERFYPGHERWITPGRRLHRDHGLGVVRQPTASGQWRIPLYHAVGQLSTGRV